MFIAPFASFSITSLFLANAYLKKMPIALQKNRTRCTDISETLRNFAVQKC